MSASYFPWRIFEQYISCETCTDISWFGEFSSCFSVNSILWILTKEVCVCVCVCVFPPSGFFFLGFQCAVHICAEEQIWPHFSEFKALYFGIKVFFFSYLWMFPEFNSRPFLFPFCVFSLNQLWLMVLTFSSMLMALLFTELLFIIWLGSKRLV